MSGRIKNLSLSLLGLLGLSPGLVAAQSNDVGVLCSEIQGESERPTDVGCIDVLSWSWGQNNSVTGIPPIPQTPTTQAFNFSKAIDSSSDDFLQGIITGSPIKGIVEYRQYRDCGTSCQATEPYLTINFRDVVIVSNSASGSNGSSPFESVTLDFGDVSYCYRPTIKGVLSTPQCFAYSRDGNVSIPPF